MIRIVYERTTIDRCRICPEVISEPTGIARIFGFLKRRFVRRAGSTGPTSVMDNGGRKAVATNRAYAETMRTEGVEWVRRSNIR